MSIHTRSPRTMATCHVRTKVADRHPHLPGVQAPTDSCTQPHSHMCCCDAGARTRTTTQGSAPPCRWPPTIMAARLYTTTSAWPCTHAMNTLPWMVAWGHSMFASLELLLASPSFGFSTTQFHPHSCAHHPRAVSTAHGEPYGHSDIEHLVLMETLSFPYPVLEPTSQPWPSSAAQLEPCDQGQAWHGPVRHLCMGSPPLAAGPPEQNRPRLPLPSFSVSCFLEIPPTF
jgi:hypothetical protein